MTAQLRIGVDVGGTFTDVVKYNAVSESYETLKVPTTPDDLSAGVLQGLDLVVDSFGDIGFTVIGTTAGLNAFLERRGERVMLIATEGVGDSYLIARGSRERLYDLHYRRPEPLVRRDAIVEVGGRLDFEGREVTPLDETGVRRAAVQFRDGDFDSIAVCLLFSYLNSSHEAQVAALLTEELGDVPVSLSHRVANQWREYERTSTVVAEAYVAPTVVRDLNRLESGLRDRGQSSGLHVMQSSGGVLTIDAARRSPLQTLLSGPTGAATGGVALAQATGRENLILVDMGGTSFDVTLVIAGRTDVAAETVLEGHPLLMPVVNIHTVGAGGGSVAYLEAGALRVGPRSAGAVPGPACYGRGGTEPTVTDANAYLGRLIPDGFAGGRMQLDVDAAARALATIAEPLELELDEVAEGILAVANGRMAQAIRTLTVEQGVEPRDFALVAIGGAGPMHAAFLADELEIETVLVPPMAGVFSAWGMLQSEMRHDIVMPFFRPPQRFELQEMLDAVLDLESQGRELLERDEISAGAMRVDATADVRYVGQEYTLPVRLSPTPQSDSELADRFHHEHENRRGVASPGSAIELIALRLSAHGALKAPGMLPERAARASESVRVAQASFSGTIYETPLLRRSDVGLGATVAGPVLIEEPTTTVVVPPGVFVRADPNGVLVMETRSDD